MKIVEPKAEIIEDELSQLSIYQRIDTCGAVCYQRPPKPTDEEAQEFCRKMVKSGHFATLEMAVVHLVVPEFTRIPESKYLRFTSKHNAWGVVSGSIRALKEATDGFECSITYFLAKQFPLFFSSESEEDSFNADEARYIRFAQPHENPWQHQHVAVRFIINRAISMELLRHRPCSFLQESQRYCRYDDEVVFIRPEWTYGERLEETETRMWELHMSISEQRYKGMLNRGLTPQQARAVLPNSTKTELVVYANLPQWKHIFSLRDSKAADPEMVRVMKPLHQEFKEKYPEAFV